MNQARLKELFEYRDGALYWKKNKHHIKAGSKAGRLLNTGYRQIGVDGRKYQEHRLIYIWHHETIPHQIDHINRDKADNRIENLRAATPSQNQFHVLKKAGISGHRGVKLIKKTGRWAANICINFKEIRIGTYATPELAAEAYQSRAREIFGEFCG